MAPRENKNNAYAKFGGTNKEYYGIFRTGLLHGEQTRGGLLTESNSDNGTAVGIVDYDIQKGLNMINFFLHRESYVGMLTIDIVEKCSGVLF